MAFAQILVFLSFFFLAMFLVVGLVHHFGSADPKRPKARPRMPERMHGQYMPSTL